jgi:peptidoglycan/xylan/chitin deacetylase (PgdA/CDA1 family)
MAQPPRQRRRPITARMQNLSRRLGVVALAILMWMVLGAALVGCAHGPDVTQVAVPSGGKVLGRNERLLIYQSAPGETLNQIAQRFLGDSDRDWVISDFNHITQADPAQPLVVPLAQPNRVGVFHDRYQTVPILCYHRFAQGSPGKGMAGKMTVSAAAFAAQLDWLAQNDFHVLRLSQLEGWLAGKQALPQRSVVITVDDGYESFYRYAFPLLRQHGFAATLFAYTDFIGASDALNWTQLQTLSDSGLVDVQAHSRTHRKLIERDDNYPRMLANEIRTPRELLERKLHITQRHYAYPYGDANDAVLTTLANQGVQLAVTVNPGGNAFFAQPLFLRRTMIYGDTSLEEFKALVQINKGMGWR